MAEKTMAAENPCLAPLTTPVGCLIIALPAGRRHRRDAGKIRGRHGGARVQRAVYIAAFYRDIRSQSVRTEILFQRKVERRTVLRDMGIYGTAFFVYNRKLYNFGYGNFRGFRIRGIHKRI